MKQDLDYTFMNMTKSNYETCRRNTAVEGKKIKAIEKPKETDYKKIARITAYALLSVGIIAAVAYFQTKANMQGVNVMGGSSGFTTLANGIDPSFGEVIEEMFGTITETIKGGL